MAIEKKYFLYINLREGKKSKEAITFYRSPERVLINWVLIFPYVLDCGVPLTSAIKEAG